MMPILPGVEIAFVLAYRSAALVAAISADSPSVSRFFPASLYNALYAMSPVISGVLLSTVMHGNADASKPVPLITARGFASWVAAMHALSNDVASSGSQP